MGEDAVPALRQRAPRLRLHAESLHVLNSPALREEGVQFHLIDHGRDARVETKVGETIRIEVAHANGAGAASLVELLHRPPGGVVIVHRLVDEVEVYVVKAQFVQRGLERGPGALIAGVLYPQLGGDEQLLAGNAAFADGRAHGLLIEVGGSGVDEAIAHLQRLADRALAHSGFRHLKNAETLQGHLHAVAQSDIFHVSFLLFAFTQSISLCYNGGEWFPFSQRIAHFRHFVHYTFFMEHK